MSSNYEEQNQREAATKIAECTDLPTAIEYLAQWADWECGDPRIICQNIADYIRSNHPVQFLIEKQEHQL
jgi:hypothetical protein